MNRKTISSLNILRLLFALAIVVHHTEQYRAACGLTNYWDNSTIISLGKTGIIFFFVLSGFLVTNSIFTNEQFLLKTFYRKRFLRIAPLYYTLVISSIVLFSNIELLNEVTPSHLTTTQIVLYAGFLPNIALALFPADTFLAHTWFVGTLEQFHLLSAFLYKCFKKYRVFVLCSIIAIYWIVGVWLKLFANETTPYVFWHLFNIDCVALGALFAVFLQKDNRLTELLTNSWLFIFAVFAIILLLVTGIIVPFFHNQICAVIFCIVIFYLTKTKKTFPFSKSKVITFLSKTTYSIYMLHPIVIIFITNVLYNYSVTILYGAIFSLTLLIASLSYVFIERPLIKKDKNLRPYLKQK